MGALAEGLILGPLAVGLFLSYRVCRIIDLTTDGSFGIGVALTAALLIRGHHPIPATLAGTLAGVIAGVVTGLLHTRLRIDPALAGILSTTSLYSLSLFVMGGGNLSLVSVETMDTPVTLIVAGILTVTIVPLLGFFLRTDLGLALRAAGDNPGMARSVAVDVDGMLVGGLGLANGLVALSGAMLAQFQGYASTQVGIGMIVTGLAALLLGESLIGKEPLGRWLTAAVIGAVLFRLTIAGAIYLGLNPNALKLVTALFVLLALTAPARVARLLRSRSPAANHG